MAVLQTIDLLKFSVQEILRLIENKRMEMTEQQLALALRGKRYPKKTREILHGFFVEKRSRQDLIKAYGVSGQWLSGAIANTLRNYQLQLEKHELVHMGIIVHKDKAPLLRIIESDDIQKQVK